MNKSQLKFNVLSTHDSIPLGFEVWLDNTKLQDNNSFTGKTTIIVDVVEDDLDHVLKFILKNKRPEHTKIGTSGEIISDARLKIEDISFDDIRLTYDMLQLITYTHDLNGTDIQKKDKFYGEMGCNGTLELNFSTPIYLWLLTNM